MPLDILLPLILVPLVALGGFVLYRRMLGRLAPDSHRQVVSGVRLTSEHLRRLPSPPWRVVFEIGPDRLGDVDHVVIGPPGVIAITTVLAERPAGPLSTDPTLLAAGATARGAVDDLVDPIGLSCDVLAKVFWGSPQDDQPASRDLTRVTVGIVGQRLGDWLGSLPTGVLTPGQVDLAWQAIVTGIGRPDPLS